MSTPNPEDIQVVDRSASELPGGAVKVAVATVAHELIGDTETYWLTPASDGNAGHELWSEFDMLPGRYVCEVWLRDDHGLTDEKAAEQLLEALWMKRYPPALSLCSFEEDGLVSMKRLKQLRLDYAKRLKPTKAPRLAITVRGELHYDNGSMKYRGQLRGKIPHGVGIGYWENGNVWCEGHFKDGEPHGHCRVYFSSGRLRHEGEFVEGRPEGRGREYREDGTPWFEGIFGRQGMHYGYGARIWVDGRLYDREGNLVHEGKFISNGKHSSPIVE